MVDYIPWSSLVIFSNSLVIFFLFLLSFWDIVRADERGVSSDLISVPRLPAFPPLLSSFPSPPEITQELEGASAGPLMYFSRGNKW